MVEDGVLGLWIDDEGETRLEGVGFAIDLQVKTIDAAGDFLITGESKIRPLPVEHC